MSEPLDKQTALSKVPASPSNKGGQRFVLIFVFLGLAGLIVFYTMHSLSSNFVLGTAITNTNTPSVSSNAEYEARLNDFSERLKALEAKNQSNNEAQHVPQKIEDGASHDTNLDNLRQTLVALSAKVEALDHAVQTSGTLTALQAEEQKSLKETLAFLNLREAALSGHAFDNEWRGMSNATKDNPTLSLDLSKLQNPSSHGIHTLSQLSEAYIGLESTLMLSIKRSAAQNWHEKLFAEISGLISIRPLHSQPGDGPLAILTDIENKLTADDLAGVLDDIKLLPPETKGSLDEWRQAVEDRYNVEIALKDIGSYLASSGDKGSP